jgi:iron complex transport system substrate-binding protein
MTSQQIDKTISQYARTGKDIYILDTAILKKSNPDVIIAQRLCAVCSPFTNEVNKALEILKGSNPDVILLDPSSLQEILDNIIYLANKLGKPGIGKKITKSLQERMYRVSKKCMTISAKPKVLCIEWLDPFFSSGHWIPEMVEIAGGVNGIGFPGKPSRRMSIEEIERYDPDVIILMPCGFDISRTRLEYHSLENDDKWNSLRAVTAGNVYIVDSNSYFSKPGPRIFTGLEIISKIIHPILFKQMVVPRNSFKRIKHKRE